MQPPIYSEVASFHTLHPGARWHAATTSSTRSRPTCTVRAANWISERSLITHSLRKMRELIRERDGSESGRKCERKAGGDTRGRVFGWEKKERQSEREWVKVERGKRSEAWRKCVSAEWDTAGCERQTVWIYSFLMLWLLLLSFHIVSRLASSHLRQSALIPRSDHATFTSPEIRQIMAKRHVSIINWHTRCQVVGVIKLHEREFHPIISAMK